MNSRLMIPLLCTGALALACGPRSQPDATVANTSHAALAQQHATAPRTPQRARLARRDGELVPSLAVNATGRTIHFALAVENAGSKTLEMHFPDGQTHDIVLLDAAGREVWRWAEGRMFTQAHRTKPLSSGDTLRVEEQLDASQLHGRFTAVAVLRSTNYPVEQRVSFDLP